MKYKGYEARVEYDHSIGILHGRVLNTLDVITFQTKNVDDLETAFKESVEDYIEACVECGKEPEKPFSGVLQLRLGARLHRAASITALHLGISLNSWIKNLVEEAVPDRSLVCAVEEITDYVAPYRVVRTVEVVETHNRSTKDEQEEVEAPSRFYKNRHEPRWNDKVNLAQS